MWRNSAPLWNWSHPCIAAKSFKKSITNTLANSIHSKTSDWLKFYCSWSGCVSTMSAPAVTTLPTVASLRNTTPLSNDVCVVCIFIDSIAFVCLVRRVCFVLIVVYTEIEQWRARCHSVAHFHVYFDYFWRCWRRVSTLTIDLRTNIEKTR